MSTFNDRIIAEFDANDGRVDSAGFGTSLVLLHTTGARTGAPRVNPVMALPEGDGWLVVASAKGAPTDPAWAVNLRARPDVRIQAVVDGHAAVVPVTAVELDGVEREAAFARFVERAPAFAGYQDRAGRRLPVIRLTRAATRSPAPQPTRPTPPATTTDHDQGAPMTPAPTPSEPTTPTPGAGTPVPVGPDDPGRSLSVRRPGTDRDLPHYGVVGDNYTILLTGADTDGRYALIDMLIPPGGGPPPHRHDFEEMFHVLAGELDLTFRGQTRSLAVGDTVNVPARAPHFFHNSSDADARVLCMVTPPGLDEYFSRWGQALPDGTTAPSMSADEQTRALDLAIALGPTYAIENLPPD